MDGRESGRSEYAPTVSAQDAERIRRWHEDAYRMARQAAAEARTYDYLGSTIVVPPQVQPITGMSHLLGKAVLAEVRDTDQVLDMGTGSGVNAILAASRSGDVLGVDINPIAVEAARDNVARNGVADRVRVRHSDVFSDVDGGYDLIIFDPPFRWFAPRDLQEVAITDENYAALTRFFRGVRDHLTAQGRVLIFFGSSGDLGYLKRLIREERFSSEVVASDHVLKDGWRVNYFTFRLAT
ncbi:MAG: methyltransferase [Micromonosporaceae bacterium]